MADPRGFETFLTGAPVWSHDVDELVSRWDGFEVTVSAGGEEEVDEGLVVKGGPGVLKS